MEKQSQQYSLGTSESSKENQIKHIWASTAYEVHISVTEVYLPLSGESIGHLVATYKAVKRYFSNKIKSPHSYRYNEHTLKDSNLTHEWMGRCYNWFRKASKNRHWSIDQEYWNENVNGGKTGFITSLKGLLCSFHWTST